MCRCFANGGQSAKEAQRMGLINFGTLNNACGNVIFNISFKTCLWPWLSGEKRYVAFRPLVSAHGGY